MKLQITGASAFVNRMFEACGSYQWAREFLKNSLEADAKRVEFGIEWQAAEKLGVYRRTIIDDGSGMDRDELFRFFSTLGEGGKKIGGIHDNFGVGAKIAALPWNPLGLVVISYKSGQASMIWIVLEDDGDYELVEFEQGGSQRHVLDPSTAGEIEQVDWGALRPEWLTTHGTIIVLLGSPETPDTVLGNPHAGEAAIKGLPVYLNTRFLETHGVDVRVAELRSENKTRWPQSRNDSDDTRRPNNRAIMGARYYLTDVKAQEGRLAASGVVPLDEERVKATWYLWEGERPAVDSYAKKSGYVAVRYKNELFELSSSKVDFRSFGIIESKVQQGVSIILEPQLYEPPLTRWGIHPDQSRNRLIFTGNGEKGGRLPMSDWGQQFAENMPPEVLAAIHRARGGPKGSIDDEDYRKRLQERFGNRWKVKLPVAKKLPGGDAPNAELVPDAQIDIFGETDEIGILRRRRRKRSVKVVRDRVTAGQSTESEEREIPVDIPSYRLVNMDEFQVPWHLALWAPNDPDGPTVLINVDSPILEEIVKYHQEQYPDVYAEQVAEIVRDVFGEVAVAKVAHSQKLAKRIPVEELDAEYRNEKALTIALMGLLAEEAVISTRLGKLGRKKTAAS